MSEEQVAEFVDVEVDENDDDWEELKVDNDYLICKTFPYQIKRKSNGYIVSEWINNHGYPCVHLNAKKYLKHVIVSRQFLNNPDPEHLTDIDHISRDRTDYHLSNLRFVSHSDNMKNITSHNGVNYQYVDDIPDESMIVDFYETRYERYEFNNYYYHDGVFYYDNDMNYRILHINTNKSGNKFINIIDINGRRVSVYINRFLQQHDLI